MDARFRGNDSKRLQAVASFDKADFIASNFIIATPLSPHAAGNNPPRACRGYNRCAMPAAIVLVLTLSTALFFASKGNRVLVTLAAVDAGAGPLQIGILFALHGLFPLLLAIVAGRAADRFNNKRLIYCGITGYSFSLAIPYVWPGLSALYFSAAIGGFGNMLFVLALQNLIGVLSTDATRKRHYSWYALGESAGHGLGPLFIGLCIDNFNATLTFLIAAVFSALWLPVAFFFRQHFRRQNCRALKRLKRQASRAAAAPCWRYPRCAWHSSPTACL